MFSSIYKDILICRNRTGNIICPVFLCIFFAVQYIKEAAEITSVCPSAKTLITIFITVPVYITEKGVTYEQI